MADSMGRSSGKPCRRHFLGKSPDSRSFSSPMQLINLQEESEETKTSNGVDNTDERPKTSRESSLGDKEKKGMAENEVSQNKEVYEERNYDEACEESLCNNERARTAGEQASIRLARSGPGGHIRNITDQNRGVIQASASWPSRRISCKHEMPAPRDLEAWILQRFRRGYFRVASAMEAAVASAKEASGLHSASNGNKAAEVLVGFRYCHFETDEVKSDRS
ncbi:unnamed protein product [Protopolystoma xenopodis]|uniref:Uncharacterized protein n=1 Tax=Protopolystoma xenopodis TaxID=117903 RepID=A0A3S5ARP0_9PLAT|nr:unnamed protein product [Protopolystoma xenopodis]